MLSKTFINKCLFYLNKVGHKYHNVSYSITRFNNFVSLGFQILDTNKNIIVKTFVAHIGGENSFTDMTVKLNKFIQENNKLLC